MVTPTRTEVLTMSIGLNLLIVVVGEFGGDDGR
jgi:hypothetical protein